MTSTEALVREIEARARRAWPALEEEWLEGWLLRCASGATRRSNSVHAVDPVDDVPAAVGRTVEWFRARSLPPRFHVHPAIRPTGLDDALAARGWSYELGAQVQVAELDGDPRSPADAGRYGEIADEPIPGWIDRFSAWRGMGAAARDAHLAILARVPAPRAFATVGEVGRPRAVGLGVRDGAWLGLFDLVTDPAGRRSGWGRFLVRLLLGWGWDDGARRAYLQVENRNIPAIRLYESLGFRIAYCYGYRLAPDGMPGAPPSSGGEPDSASPPTTF